MSETLHSYKDLIVWQKTMVLVDATYKLTRGFPGEERYGLTSQMRRAAVSIPSNIAEGRRRGSRKDYRNFLIQAYGSGAELETQIEIAKRQKFGSEKDYSDIGQLISEVMRMLNSMIVKLQAKKLNS